MKCTHLCYTACYRIPHAVTLAQKKPDLMINLIVYNGVFCSHCGLQTTFVGPAALAADTLRVCPIALQALGFFNIFGVEADFGALMPVPAKAAIVSMAPLGQCTGR
jgi:hypothetical protein